MIEQLGDMSVGDKASVRVLHKNEPIQWANRRPLEDLEN